MSDPNYSTQGRWIQGIVQGANNTVVNIFHAGFKSLSGTLSSVFREMMAESARNNSSLLDIQDQYLVEQGKLKIEQERLSYEIISSERIAAIKQREIELKEWFFENKIQLIQECHAESVQLKLQEFQNIWDVHYLPFLLSCDHTQKLFFQGNVRFWVLLAPPKILCDIQDFSSLDAEIEHRLKGFVGRYYLSEKPFYPVGCRKIFKKSIENIQAIHARELLAPIPTLILQGIITDQDVLITITCPKSVEVECDNQVPLPSWNWEAIKDDLELKGLSSKESIRCIKELIITLHVVIALYFLDLYCLNLVDPYHNPKLFDFLKESDSSEALLQWTEPYKNSLLQEQDRVRKRVLETSQADEFHARTNYIENSSDNWPGCFSAMGAVIFVLILVSFLSQIPSTTSPIDSVDNGIVNPGQTDFPIGSRAKIIERASVREKALENSNLLAEAEIGDIAIVQETYGSWVRLKFKSGVDGWVYDQKIEPTR